MSDTKTKVLELYKNLSEEQRRAFGKVLNAEKAKLHLLRADGIILDLEKIIREEIK